MTVKETYVVTENSKQWPNTAKEEQKKTEGLKTEYLLVFFHYLM